MLKKNKAHIKKNGQTIVIIAIIFLIVISNFYFYRFTIDIIIVILAIIALIYRKQKAFIVEWSIPIVLFYIYEFMRGKAEEIAFFLGRPLVNQWLIDTEKLFFGINNLTPTENLQYNLSNAASGAFIPNWYDYILFFFYASFFWFWLATGFVLWRKNKNIFKRYIYGLMFFSLFDVLIYILFPSAPPWYAAQVGLLMPLTRLMWAHNYFPSDSISLLNTYSNNDFAALPSHHAAWPFFASLFIIKLFGKKALPILIVPLVISFTTWYGAEHYIIDSILGFAIAGFSYWAMGRIFKAK